MKTKDEEIKCLKETIELAKNDLKAMAMSNTHGLFCKHWDECWYKCSNDCINWQWRYDTDIGKCLKCGNKLKECWHKDYNYEINGYEDVCDVYCPNCDIKIVGENFK